jgi:tRNA modification GTPase
VCKSSLLNALTGEERAIVTAIPGTTRDIVSGEMLLDGCVIHLTDTAGLRDTEDVVEQIGVERARRAVEQADCILLVLDASAPLSPGDRDLLPHLDSARTAILLNKSDLPAVLTAEDASTLLPGAQVLTLSAHDPRSLQPVKDFLRQQSAITDNLTLTQPRHLEAARRAVRHLRDAAATMEIATVDLATVDLQSAQLALAEITGDQIEEKLLDKVFSEFCVGK